MLVDDHPQFVEALKFILFDYFSDKIDFIDVARNGEECLDQLKQKYFDFIFMDIDMPIMNGIEATKRLVEKYRDIVIIALSFHADMKYIIQMIEAGARSYIIKEEINKDLLEKVLKK